MARVPGVTKNDHPLNGDIRARAKAQAKYPGPPPSPPKVKAKKRKQSKAGKKLVAKGKK